MPFPQGTSLLPKRLPPESDLATLPSSSKRKDHPTIIFSPTPRSIQIEEKNEFVLCGFLWCGGQSPGLSPAHHVTLDKTLHLSGLSLVYKMKSRMAFSLWTLLKDSPALPYSGYQGWERPEPAGQHFSSHTSIPSRLVPKGECSQVFVHLVLGAGNQARYSYAGPSTGLSSQGTLSPSKVGFCSISYRCSLTYRTRTDKTLLGIKNTCFKGPDQGREWS